MLDGSKGISSIADGLLVSAVDVCGLKIIYRLRWSVVLARKTQDTKRHAVSPQWAPIAPLFLLAGEHLRSFFGKELPSTHSGILHITAALTLCPGKAPSAV